MSKHTPGPWNIHPSYTDMKPWVVNSNDDMEPWVSCSTYIAQDEKIVASVEMRTDGNGGYPHVRTRGEMIANARLIAAAPELLEALERVCRSLGYYLDHAPRNLADGDYGASLAFSNAHNVIAKAKGEAQDERQD